MNVNTRGDIHTSETAYFGGGCFWCLEAIFQRVNGVREVVSGYAGGGIADSPTYQNHGDHAEVVAVSFDPQTITYQQLLELFWHIHDPTTLNRQGNDVGRSYRSIILYASEQQKVAAQASCNSVAAQVWDDPIVTEIKPLDRFTRAEEYHQDFFNQNPNNGYCQVIINPKIAKFKKTFAHLLAD